MSVVEPIMAHPPQFWYERGTEALNQARAKDDAKDYEAAMRDYIKGAELLGIGLKGEKNDKTKTMVRVKVEEYIKRAEVLKKFLAEHQQQQQKKPVSPAPGAAAKPAATAAANNNKQEEPPIDVSSLVLVEKPNVSWDDVAGLATAKRCLIEAVMLPHLLPHLFEPQGPVEPWKGVLLYGPPGTGKTLLAKAVATEAKCTMIVASCENIFKKYVGESEQTVMRIFELARQSKPACIIFFDELDSIAQARKENMNEAALRTLTTLLTQMDGLQSQGKSNDARVTVIGATNKPWSLDDGIIRRFDRRIFIPLPDSLTRMKIFQKALNRKAEKGLHIQVEGEQYAALAEATEGFSAADVATCVKSVTNKLMQTILDATHWQQSVQGTWRPCSPGTEGAIECSWQKIQNGRIVLPSATFGVLMSAIGQVKSSVRQETLKQYEDFTVNSGIMGV